MKRTLWVLPFGVAAALWALWQAGSSTPASVTAGPPAPPVADANVPAPLESERQPSGATPKDDANKQEGQLDASRLRQLCGRPWEAAFSAECVAALEQRYRDKVPGTNTSTSNPGHFRPVMLGESITWAQVFDGTADALAAARQALGREECLV